MSASLLLRMKAEPTMVTIQRANPDQANQLTHIALAAKAYWGYPKRWMDIWKPQLTIDTDYITQNETWVAEIHGAPIAFCGLRDKDGSAWLEDLWVLPEYIGKGVGRMLFSTAVQLSRERGYQSLQLESDPNAVGFYEKMGMHKIRERHSEVDGQPRILPVMELEL